jgi:hypothetical protein
MLLSSLLQTTQEFGTLCREKTDDEVIGVLPYWQRLYNKLCIVSFYFPFAGILDTQGLQSLRQSNYTPFTLEIVHYANCSQKRECVEQKEQPG